MVLVEGRSLTKMYTFFLAIIMRASRDNQKHQKQTDLMILHVLEESWSCLAGRDRQDIMKAT